MLIPMGAKLEIINQKHNEDDGNVVHNYRKGAIVEVVTAFYTDGPNKAKLIKTKAARRDSIHFNRDTSYDDLLFYQSIYQKDFSLVSPNKQILKKDKHISGELPNI